MTRWTWQDLSKSDRARVAASQAALATGDVSGLDEPCPECQGFGSKRAQGGDGELTWKCLTCNGTGTLTERKKKAWTDREGPIQRNCWAWSQMMWHAPFWRHIPNEVKVSGPIGDKARRARKREGVVSGWADLELLIPAGGYMGLAAELKSSDGRQSAAQKVAQAIYEAAGWKYCICKGQTDAKSVDVLVRETTDYLLQLSADQVYDYQQRARAIERMRAPIDDWGKVDV